MFDTIKKLFKRSDEVEVKKETVRIVEPYKIKINVEHLTVRKGPYRDCNEAGTVKENDTFIIVEEVVNKDGETWGLLKACRKKRNGWINLKYVCK